MSEKREPDLLDNNILQFAKNLRSSELPVVTITAHADDPGITFRPPSQAAAYFARRGGNPTPVHSADPATLKTSATRKRLKGNAHGQPEPLGAAHARSTLRLTEPLLSLVWSLSQQYREIPTKTVYRLLKEALEARELL
jgi:hypothetical protein